MPVDDPDRLSLSGDVPGMGCVVRGLFFVTFALGAWALLGGAAGLIFALVQDRPIPYPGLAVSLIAGVSLAVPGGLVAFTGGHKVLDRSRNQLVHTWTVLGVPVRRWVSSIAEAGAVAIEPFPVNPAIRVGVLRGVEPRVELFRAGDAASARRMGRRVARFLELPLLDCTAAETVRVEADALDDAFAARHPEARPPDPHVPAAIGMEERPDGATLRFPAKGLGPLELGLTGLFGLLLLPACAGAALGIAGPSDTDLWVNVVCYGVAMALFFAVTLLPVLWRSLVGAEVDIREGGLTLRYTGLSRRERRVEGAEIDGIVHVSRAEFAGTPKQRLRPGEVTLRLTDGDVSLGIGQPDGDLAWAAQMLIWQLVRTTRGPDA